MLRVRESDWHYSVYKMNHKESGLTQAEWRLLRDQILARDNFTCLRCDKKFRYKKNLSVHHVIPRADGGSNDPTNLVTLCNPCHDYVEVNDLRTRADIMGSVEIEAGIVEAEDEPESDWHTWVYGGRRNPNLGR